ncbi:MAG: hypothetical protein KJ566_00640 [Nanoarchaeota archaeon]|nr:hypothetical protein [Nanoarchaeota archaeon]
MTEEKEWNQNKAVGNISESIIEMMINSMPDWKCVKFGVENHIEELRKVVKTDINETTKRIKSMPDFIAYNTKERKTFFIEVKYRSFIDKREGKSEYKIDFLEEYLEYWKGTKLIVINPTIHPYFFVIDLDDVKDDMCRMEQNRKDDYYWNFKEIEKELKDLFPELKKEVIEDATKLIPSLKDKG